MGVATGADASDDRLQAITELENAMDILRTTALVALTSLLLSACAQEEKPEGVIPEVYKGALDKAQGIEGNLEDAVQRQGQQIDETGN